jgi:oxygen-independent coproporphyrinogen-3 oxidase
VNETIRRYARLQVPRYTSYPTAAEFTTDVAGADQRRWLHDLGRAEAVSVYLHVPYCRELPLLRLQHQEGAARRCPRRLSQGA